MSELDDMKAQRDQINATIRNSAERLAAGKRDAYLTEHSKAQRLKLLETLEANILKFEGPYAHRP